MNDERKLSGRCHCGGISYVVTGEASPVGHCYCRNCQRLTGTGHSSAAIFPQSRVAVSGTPTEYSFTTKAGVVETRFFCPTCGSCVLGKNSAAPSMLGIALGTLDDVNALQPQAAIHAQQRASWDVLDERIHNFEGSAVAQGK